MLPLTGEARTPVPAIKPAVLRISRAGVTRWSLARLYVIRVRAAEIFVRSFPTGQRVVQISASGGFTPRWRADGREIYYMTSYDHGKVMAVSLDRGRTPPGEPQELFGVDMAVVPHSTVVQNFHTYAVSPDGQRFVIAVPSSTLAGEGSASAIAVVLGWPALLRQ